MALLAAFLLVPLTQAAESQPPSIRDIGVRKFAACGDGGTDCATFELMADVRLPDGRTPTAGDDILVMLSEWNAYYYTEPYRIRQDESTGWFHGPRDHWPLFVLPATERYRLHATYNGQTSIVEFEVEYAPDGARVLSQTPVSPAATEPASSSAPSSAQPASVPASPTASSSSSSGPIALPRRYGARASSSSAAASRTEPSNAAGLLFGFEQDVASTGRAVSWFGDVDPQTTEGNAANQLAKHGVIGGFPDGEFKGGRMVNRAEASKFLLYALYDGIPTLPNSGKFSDVLEDQWYTKFVMAAADRGIIAGDPGGTFRPADGVNTAEFLKMLTIAFGLPRDLPHQFRDVPQDAWYQTYAGIAQRYDLFPGRGDRLEPGRKLTRDEVAVAIHRLLEAQGIIQPAYVRSVDMNFKVIIREPVVRASTLLPMELPGGQRIAMRMDLYIGTRGQDALAVYSLPEGIRVTDPRTSLDGGLAAAFPGDAITRREYGKVDGFEAVDYEATMKDGDRDVRLAGRVIATPDRVYHLLVDQAEMSLDTLTSTFRFLVRQ